MTMTLIVELQSQAYQIDLNSALDISIPIRFDEPQVNHFGAPRATSTPLTVGSYVGSTLKGASCNADQLSITPHCNGTHTECAGHIINESLSVYETLDNTLCLAQLITVQPVLANESDDSYIPQKEGNDLIISQSMLVDAIDQAGDSLLSQNVEALIIRVLPNTKEKTTYAYSQDNQAAFFSCEAMSYLSRLKITHLLVDLPSLDRMYDEGLLSNHHCWWNIPQRKNSGLVSTANADALLHRTVTELIYVDETILDGIFLLNLQVPSIQSDAVPSRPLLFPIQAIRRSPINI
ncbi:MAG: hypothetical protein COB04_15340 [Gammaproteobacteria bacterium]|nr:MAG: hypothetical protein COB04_15340 [Gammaproteobacteria bacterium]